MECSSTVSCSYCKDIATFSLPARPKYAALNTSDQIQPGKWFTIAPLQEMNVIVNYRQSRRQFLPKFHSVRGGQYRRYTIECRLTAPSLTVTSPTNQLPRTTPVLSLCHWAQRQWGLWAWLTQHAWADPSAACSCTVSCLASWIEASEECGLHHALKEVWPSLTPLN